MKNFYLKGVLVPDEDKWLYDLFGIDATTHKDVRNFLEDANGEEVTIYIDSPGGVITTGSNIYSELREYKGKSTSFVTGWAASAASWAMLGSDWVIASPTARFMLHNAQGVAEGDYRDMEAAAGRLKNANNSFINAYQLKSGKSREEIQAILDKETFYIAQEALENGLIDEIALKEGEQLEPLIAAAMPMGGINIQKMHELAAKYKDNPEGLLEQIQKPETQEAESGGGSPAISDRLKIQQTEFNKLRKKLYH
jgi:ATP-dependent Clp protease protease subunit